VLDLESRRLTRNEMLAPNVPMSVRRREGDGGGRALRGGGQLHLGPWGPTGVGVCTDNFSVGWVKTQSFTAGTCTFTVTADDGVRVYLDGSLVIDQWKDQPPTTYTASRSVSAGDHTVSVEYYEHTEVAVARLAIST
jgi:hypothetical protein